jgi:DNA-binding NtrC family response regulator
MKFNILLIDDENSQREMIAGFLKKKGYNVLQAESGEKGLELLKKNQIDFVLSDMKMSGISGREVLEEVQKLNPEIPVVISTAYGEIDSAVNLMKSGAFDYLQKPIELSDLLKLIERARERSFLIAENKALKEKLSAGEKKSGFTGIISHSNIMEEVLNTTARVAATKANVLIRGESGTGKELIAKTIHYSSPRKDEPFVVVNCAALPETLFESELFGHEKGAFTGADRQRIGKFEEANGGTIFIDEVGDIPMPIQVKLLRAIQFGQIQRLGGNKTIDLDVRIVSATNRNLEEMIAKAEFREDLFYRFNVVSINIPPLKKRKSDIPVLIEHFINKFSESFGKEVTGISKEALDVLMKYDFPGNIRELENIIQRAIVMARDNLISTADLSKNIANPEIILNNEENEFFELGDLNQKIEDLEKTLITKALDETSGNQTKAAEILKITERTLRYKIKKYGLK